MVFIILAGRKGNPDKGTHKVIIKLKAGLGLRTRALTSDGKSGGSSL